jgi:AcrR family transcriptional regulator
LIVKTGLSLATKEPSSIPDTAKSRRLRSRARQSADGPVAEPRLRYREINKADKRERIKAAARMLFTQAGYDHATLRQIAARAGVALGTLSLYADDKRDLILLVYNDHVEAMIARGAARVRDRGSLIDNLMAFFRVFYEGYAANLQLARTYLEVNFFTFGMNTKGLAQNRQRKIEAVEKIVKLGQRRGDVRSDVKPSFIAMQLLFLHSSAVRTWIAQEEPSVRAGITTMRKLISLQAQGLRRA